MKYLWFASYVLFWVWGLIGYYFTTNEDYLVTMIVMTILISIGWIFKIMLTDA